MHASWDIQANQACYAATAFDIKAPRHSRNSQAGMQQPHHMMLKLSAVPANHMLHALKLSAVPANDMLHPHAASTPIACMPVATFTSSDC
jgi:hypothetical protein